MAYKQVIGDDGSIEILCEHGIGHNENLHTCDGCNVVLHKKVRIPTS